MKLVACSSFRIFTALLLAIIYFFLAPGIAFAQATEKVESELLQLARKEFASMNSAEVKFFESASKGEAANYRVSGKVLPDGERTIRSDRIEWLLENQDAISLIPQPNSVIGANGAIIQHQIKVRNVKLPFNLSFSYSEFRRVEFVDSELKSLYLSAAKGNYVTVRGSQLDGYVFLSSGEFLSVNFVDSGVTKETSLIGCKVKRSVDFSQARLSKDLRLSGAEISVLKMDDTDIGGSLLMRDAKVSVSTESSLLAPNTKDAISAKSLHVGRFIEFSTSTKITGNANFENLEANSIKMSGDSTKKMSVKGAFKLKGATIRSDLDMRYVHFESHENDSFGDAFYADRLTVGGQLLLNHIHCEGEIRLIAANVTGDLMIKDSILEHESKTCLLAGRIRVGGLLSLENSTAIGRVSLSSAQIESQVIFLNAKLVNPEAIALNAKGAKVGAELILNQGFESTGEVKLNNLVADEIWLHDGKFSNPGNVAINLVGVETSYINARRIKCDGEMKIIAGKVGQLICSGEFNNSEGHSITAVNSEFNSGVILKDGFISNGSVRFSESKIKPYIRCENAQFFSPSKTPLEVGSEAFSIAQSTVDGRVEIKNSTIEGGLNLSNIKINGPLIIKDLKSPNKAVWDLRGAQATTFDDDSQSWPSTGNLYVHGFEYDNLSDESPRDAKLRLDWLDRVGDEHFTSEPYEHLAEVLIESGRQDDATTVLIAKAKKQGAQSSFFSGQGFWYRVLGPLIGYGYQPWRSLWIGMVIVILGCILFSIGEKFRIVTPAKEAEHVFEANEHRLSNDYPVFEGLMYSIDVFVPLLDLHQAQYWMPSAKRGRVLFKTRLGEFRTGRLLRTYLWFQIFAGWTLTTLLVSALSGMLRL